MLKLSFYKTDLLGAVNTVLKAVPARTTMSILECILIEAKSGEIRLTSNDTELVIETKAKGEILEEGQIAINAKVFSEIIRKLPDNTVTLEERNNERLYITCEKSKFHLSGLQGEDFPRMPSMNREKSFSLSQFTLKETIRQTIFSIASNENNKVMTGELFEAEEDQFHVVALDGHRISIRNVTLRERTEALKVIVPGKTLMEVSRILTGDIDSNVTVFVGKNQILFEFDDTKVMSRLIEGKYFRVKQMINGDYNTKIRVNKATWTESLERAVLLVRENDNKPLILNIQDEIMAMSLDTYIGSMREEMVIQKTGKDLMIGFNAHYLLDALRVIDEEEITLYMVDSRFPCIIRNEEQSYIYLILPVNFNVPH